MSPDEYPVAAPTPGSGPAFVLAVERALEDATVEGRVDPARLAQWVTDQIDGRLLDAPYTSDREYCPECDAQLPTYPTSLSGADRRRHDALASLERRLGAEVAPSWLSTAGSVHVDVLITAVKLATELEAHELTGFNRTIRDLEGATARLRAAQPLMDTIRDLTNHRKGATP